MREVGMGWMMKTAVHAKLMWSQLMLCGGWPCLNDVVLHGLVGPSIPCLWFRYENLLNIHVVLARHVLLTYRYPLSNTLSVCGFILDSR